MPAYPEMSGQKQVIVHEDGVASPIAANRALIDNKVSLSYNQRLRLGHRKLVEIEEVGFQGEPRYEEVTVGEDTIKQYVAPDAKEMPIAEYEESVTAPAAAFATDAAQMLALDTDRPGTLNGPSMTSENYLNSALVPGVNIPGEGEESSSS